MIFLSTPSARRATQTNTTYEFTKSDFYPRPPRGGRPAGCLADLFPAGFLSTPSARRATSRRLCAGTGQAISIHALREEGDDFFSFLCYSCTDFYPRPPRGGRLSAERTSVTSIPISIHALREEGDPVGVAAVRQQIISIHALREEGDAAGTDGAQDQKHFYPRPPRGGRQLPQWVTTMIMNFYPRPPRGGRPLQIRLDETADRFLSTPSARRATIPFSATLSLPMYFYPRPPRGGRPLALQHTVPHKPISIHALREEGDVRRSHHSCRSRISIHALREEGDLVQS